MIHFDTDSGAETGKAGNQVAQLVITLNEETLARLRKIAEQQGDSPEQFLVDWAERLTRSYPAPRSSDKKVYSTLDIDGILTDVEPLTGGNEEIDRLIAEEAINPHDGE